ncbi:hypothetical protein [Yersinia mollaretii]|uniref:hypothetical protein n=1 Tax=Yersinia mollaretii TaxID=33060 RepID=UPI001643D942|nr:hypothetical protein [Yersinia mollaretii]
MTKFAVQLMNCQEDAVKAVMEIDSMSSTKAASDLAKIGNNLTQCQKNADMQKGSVEFIKEEVARGKAEK